MDCKEFFYSSVDLCRPLNVSKYVRVYVANG